MLPATDTQRSRRDSDRRSALGGGTAKEDLARVFLGARRGLALVRVPLDPALRAREIGTEAMPGSRGARGGIHAAQ